MNWRAVAFASVAVNLFLVAWWAGPKSRASRTGPALGVTQAQGGAGSSQTNLVVRRQFFSWHEIESQDYPTYIANLRAISCPETTIRDIIIADVNSVFARRRANEMVTPEQQWWRSEPDTNVLQAAAEKARTLEEERLALLTRLLGTNWESGDLVTLPRPTRPGIVLDGPVLGVLPAETKLALQEVNARSQERMQAYLEAQVREGKNADPEELARLRQQTRLELAGILPPMQLEEFLLRYSQNANDLRAELGQLKFFNASPEEFRTVFRAVDSIDLQLQGLVGNDPSTVQQRRVLEESRETAIRTALGARRYEEYRNLQDPLYRDAMAAAIQAGTPEAARTIYQVNLAAQAEQASIASDTNLTSSQRSLALKRLDLEQSTATTLATGQELPPEPPPPQPPRRSYVVHPGDNLSVVAMIFGVPVGAIRQANPNVNFSRLRPGDSLFIPPATQNPFAAP
jgi:LysM repeat protein